MTNVGLRDCQELHDGNWESGVLLSEQESKPAIYLLAQRSLKGTFPSGYMALLNTQTSDYIEHLTFAPLGCNVSHAHTCGSWMQCCSVY